MSDTQTPTTSRGQEDASPTASPGAVAAPPLLATTSTAASTPPPPMGRHAAKGLVWILLNVGVSRLLQVAALAVLGSVLDGGQFGLYSLALSVGAFIQTFRDAGIRDLLVTRHKQYDELVGPCFWMSCTLNMVLGVTLGVVGEFMARSLHAAGKIENPADLSKIIWVTAAALPLGAPATVMLARLKVDMRFAALSGQITIAQVIRYGGQIVLALMGYGAMSLALPIVAISIVDFVYLYWLTREKPWKKAAEPRKWRWIWSQSQWLVYTSVVAGITAQGFSAVATPFLPDASALVTVGEVFFAIQILFTVEALLGQSLVQVMLPVLTRLNDDPVRQGNAALRVMGMAALVAAPGTVICALAFEPVRSVVWPDKWQAAAVGLLVMTPGFILRNIVVCVPSPLTQARNQFKQYFALWAILGATSLLGAAIGGAFFPTPVGLSMAIGAATGIASLWACVRAMSPLGQGFMAVMRAILPPFVLACVLGAAAWWIDREYVAGLADRLAPGGITVKGVWHPVAPLVRAAITTAVYGVVFTILARAMVPRRIGEAASILPVRVGRIVKRVMVLK